MYLISILKKKRLESHTKNCSGSPGSPRVLSSPTINNYFYTKSGLWIKAPLNHERYKQYRDTLRNIKQRSKFEYYNLQCERFKPHSKKLWTIIHEVCGKSNDKSTSLNYLTINGIKQFQSQKICNEFADLFSNIGEYYAKNIPKSKNGIGFYLSKIPINNKSLFLNPCDPVEIRKIILSLKNKKAVDMMESQTYS